MRQPWPSRLAPLPCGAAGPRAANSKRTVSAEQSVTIEPASETAGSTLAFWYAETTPPCGRARQPVTLYSSLMRRCMEAASSTRRTPRAEQPDTVELVIETAPLLFHAKTTPPACGCEEG